MESQDFKFDLFVNIGLETQTPSLFPSQKTKFVVPLPRNAKIYSSRTLFSFVFPFCFYYIRLT
jgi:hypothetical protein